MIGYSDSVTQDDVLTQYGNYRGSSYTVPEDCKYIIVSLASKGDVWKKPYSKITSGTGTYLGGCCDWNYWNGILSNMIYKDVTAGSVINFYQYGQCSILRII